MGKRDNVGRMTGELIDVLGFELQLESMRKSAEVGLKHGLASDTHGVEGIGVGIVLQHHTSSGE